MVIEEEIHSSSALPLLSLNHVSFLCKSVEDSVRFYEEVLGFVLIKRPYSFNFHGAWLFNYGIGIHLLEYNTFESLPQKPEVINPKDNHISFQCNDIGVARLKLEEMGVKYVGAVVEEGGIKVDQLFFHDPDGYMIEICNCENIPVLHLSACPFKAKKARVQSTKVGCGVMESLMMESLCMNMINFSF